MKLKITKPDSVLFEGEVKLVQLPGTGGKFEVMENHAPIIVAERSSPHRPARRKRGTV